MATPGVIMMLLAAYLIFVLKIGPDFMRKREAFKLTKVLIIYNAVQVIASAFLVQYVSQTKRKFYTRQQNVDFRQLISIVSRSI